jgi:hypothetical protein
MFFLFSSCICREMAQICVNKACVARKKQSANPLGEEAYGVANEGQDHGAWK